MALVCRRFQKDKPTNILEFDGDWILSFGWCRNHFTCVAVDFPVAGQTCPPDTRGQSPGLFLVHRRVLHDGTTTDLAYNIVCIHRSNNIWPCVFARLSPIRSCWSCCAPSTPSWHARSRRPSTSRNTSVSRCTRRASSGWLSCPSTSGLCPPSIVLIPC